MESRSRSTGADTLLQVPLADSSLMRFAPLSHSNLQVHDSNFRNSPRHSFDRVASWEH